MFAKLKMRFWPLYGWFLVFLKTDKRTLLKACAFMKQARIAPVPSENLSWRDLRNPTRTPKE